MSEAPLAIASSQTIILDKQPCCLEFCPEQPTSFVIGTYNLLPESSTGAENKVQTRDGSIIVCSLNDGNIKIEKEICLLFGVLDIHFMPEGSCTSNNEPSVSHGNSRLLGCATSSGSIALFSWSHSPNGSYIDVQMLRTLQAFEMDIVVTSLSWLTARPSTLIATLASGGVSMVEYTDHYYKTTEIMKHDLEAWIIVEDHSESLSPCVYSGGDDAQLQLRTVADFTHVGGLDETIHNHISRKRIHEAGVTAILPLFTCEAGRFLLTGAYDDRLRVIRLPYRKSNSIQPSVLGEKNIGGCPWRIALLEDLDYRLDPSGASDLDELRIACQCTLLVSGMYAGGFVIRITKVFNSTDWCIDILARFQEHESMNYASAVQPREQKTLNIAASDMDKKRMIVSTSFYDRRLCLWSW